MSETFEYIGKPLGRAEGPDKVRGLACYPADLDLPDLLIGCFLRSPEPHARIVSIDTSQALAVPGVHAALTGADLPAVRVGRALRDFEPLAQGVVRYVGQKVAAVAAESREIAQDALALIEVEYDELPAVFDPLEALSEAAPILHPDYDTYQGLPKGERTHGNEVHTARWGRGDVDAAFASADQVIEHTFRTQRQHQGYIEPHACVAMVDVGGESDGQVHVWANSKAPFQLRDQIAGGLQLPKTQVTIEPTVIGGDFGGKGGFMDTHIAVHLARATGRPVRITMDYTEELTASNPRHAGVLTFRTAVMNDGRIVARDADLTFDGGAYAAFRPSSGCTYGPRSLGGYRMEASRVVSRIAYTNLVPCGSMRSPGDPQSIYASEAHIDLVARALNMDPLEFRRMNMVDPGDESPMGSRWRAPLVKELLEAAATEIGYAGRERQLPDGRLVGIGFATNERNTGGGPCTANVSITRDARVRLSISLRDTGAGFYTMLRQVVAEELGVPYDRIEIETWSTDALPNDGGVGGARITNSGGNAALNAAREARELLAGFAANAWGWSIDAIDFRGEQLVHGDDSRTLAEVMLAYGQTASAQHSYVAPADAEATVFTAQAAKVAVDTETGAVEVLQFVSAHDVGRVLNPIAHQGQVEGGFVQGLGYALFEELLIEDGYVTNVHLGDYKMPTMRDMPPLTTLHVKSDADGPAPYGGKGIGEQSVSGVAPAITNAILDATGVSLRTLPMTAERVLAGLDELAERLRGS